MSGRFSYGMMAVLASSALSQVYSASAQETDQASEDLVQQTIVVRGEFIPDEKRETSEVSSLLGAEDFQLQGDSDVAAALRRVTGVSIADNKFVIVRGLNERYSSSTLNGSPLPSPEPLRRVAPLDLFPTSVLESTLVQKTFSPEQSGEFGGGSIDIRTKGVPDQAFFDIEVSTSYNSETSLQDGFLYDGGDTDFLGFDDGARDLPTGVGEAFATGTFNTAQNEQARIFGRDLTDNSSLLVTQEGQIPINGAIETSFGTRFDFSDALSMGVLGAASYSNDWTTRKAIRGFSTQEGSRTNFETEGTTNTIGLNALGSVGFDIYDNHSVRGTAFITRSTDKEARVETGFTRPGVDDFEERREVLEWIERELWTTQAAGEHYFPYLADLELDWRASYSEATRDAPYNTSTGYINRDGGTTLSSEPELTSISFSTINDDSTDLGIDGMVPLTLGDIEVDVKAGYAYVEKDRESQNNSLRLSGSSLFGDAGNRRIDFAYNDLFAPGSTARFQEEATQGLPGFYVGTLEVDAGYFGVDAQLTPFLRAALGVRYEDGIQVVQTRTFADADFESGDRVNGPAIEESDWLPAATLTWNFIEDLQFRIGYSETLTRPQFREVAPSRFVNSETDQSFFGNPFLVNSALTNYDARLEYYFARDQFLTFGVFYKDIENPIEEISAGDESGTTTFINVPEAELLGVEFEYQQVLPISEWIGGDWFASKDFTIKTNYTYTDSEVNATGQVSRYLFSADITGPDGFEAARRLVDAAGVIEDGRQLQGQSEHLLNFQFGYADVEANSEANLLINYASERIRSAEDQAGNVPAVLERPPLTLDFVYNRGFTFGGGSYSFGFKFQNILGDEYKAYQDIDSGTAIVDRYETGRVVSVSLKREF